MLTSFFSPRQFIQMTGAHLGPNPGSTQFPSAWSPAVGQHTGSCFLGLLQLRAWSAAASSRPKYPYVWDLKICVPWIKHRLESCKVPSVVIYVPKPFFSQSKGNQFINSSGSKLCAKEEMLLSDAAAVEGPSSVVRAVNWPSHPQADVSRVQGCPVSTLGIVQESGCSEGILGSGGC